MKINTTRRAVGSCVLLAALGLSSLTSLAQTGGNKTFNGNGNTGFGGTIGNGTLTLTDDTTNLNGTITTGNNYNDNLVIYIQTTNGGFTSTSGFTDTSDGLRHAISDPESPITFIAGFAPNYALALGPSANNFGGLWGLTNGGTLPFVSSANLTPTGTSSAGTYTFSVGLANLGLPTGSAVVGRTIKLFGTYTASSGYRSTEAIAGNDSGSQGNNPFTQTALGTYLIGELPTVTYPVTFQVDLSAVLANGDFSPANGDKVEVRGSFNSSAGGAFLAPGANTNIYNLTFQDPDALGTPESYLFDIVHTNATPGTNYETTDQRTFVLTNTQTLPVLYFSDLAPATNPTVALTFSVNMSIQQTVGKYSPGNGDQVYVYGDFNQDANFNWLPNLLTVSGTNTNVYVGTFGDGNYVGTPSQYKFVVITGGGNTNYESTANRTYFTPATAKVFPTAYFNNQSNVDFVTFQVDMSAPIIGKKFTPGVDTVTVAGAFGGWSTTADPLTNNPVNGNSNIYSAAVPIIDAPGTVEQYKFTYSGPDVGSTVYESPTTSPTIGGNRFFTVANTNAQVLPLVFFSDQDGGDVLSADTMVTFSVNMTNAVSTDGINFNTQGGNVYINGDFLGWPSWNAFLPQLSNGGSGDIYTITEDFPAGSPLVVNYKYGINGSDNEAGFGQNHVRYIRHTGTYNLPLDIFGVQTVEPSFGNLKIGAPSSGHVPITWLGRPGVHLQVRNSLTSGSWVDHPETDGLSATNWPVGSTNLFFRLIKP